MNPVLSYSDFQEYMRYADVRGQIIPIILIKPSVILDNIRTHRLDLDFEYFHNRTGDRVTFFLPGYAHYPRLECGELLSKYRPWDKNAIAFTINDRDIYYSNKAFVDFVGILEQRSNAFHYYGNTELLLVRFNCGEEYRIGDIDFRAIHRFDLTQLFLAGGSEDRGYHIVNTFLENVYHELIRFSDEDIFFSRIQLYYDNKII